MQKFGLIGYPLGHSYSPQIHNSIFKLYNINATYSLQEISPDELNTHYFENLMKEFNGLNVTIPFKTKIIEYLDEISEEAKLIGAVNTIIKKRERLTGYNTDVDGFLYPLIEKHENKKINSCLLIGTGGAARAAIYALLNNIKPLSLIILGRNIEKAEHLKYQFEAVNKDTKIKIDKIEKITNYLELADLVINSTSVGMSPNINDSILPIEFFAKEGIIFYDLIYNPQETAFLKNAKNNSINCRTINGLPMLVAQAVKAEEIWTEKSISVETIINTLDISNLLS